MNVYSEHILSIFMTENKKNRNSKEILAAVLTDLSKAFDCLLNEPLFSKLHFYGLIRSH